MLTNVRILGARKLDVLFVQKDFLFKIFFAENIWVQIGLIVAQMDFQPDNNYLEKVAETGYLGFTFGKNSFWTTHQFVKGHCKVVFENDSYNNSSLSLDIRS